ncbi:2-polyprenyl-6-hydroxyphenyl methylase/3-demethylubiquinone-9 3-methyltransferase [Sphingomonas sp. BE138]|uniref:bifunctional 2-polyprenyl-6-hydroxyphenol methylase/3-demethylubiquinol 3-O-methyltransferase UbiG n=1 Tax=Sphingomonas sp. BE138 TaxID=2817845 RepID=UPI00285DE987|nr:bifunctional 2-polyprenyl-6-hydroxyphenol methylase/3-demethylubiquinol 3-O-methyltransferase UbiG [Sphingomonas sp. BE138]MDR6788251.1 2-polyprenyl-6-hydroxyphenyl methylase/3-demethylubiquinone-9 3-methyltransferase [Sphingomonas sp. BE138]
MTDASVTTATTPGPVHASVVAGEAAHFGKLAAEWWDPTGSSAMLHRLNPVRLRYLRAAIDRHWDLDDRSFTPLAGKSALDMGCGAGLLAEPLARMGAAVTGVDAAAENVAVARVHAEGRGLAIDYRAGGVEAVAGETFDLVCSLEVIEHVSEPRAFVAGLAAAVAPGGMLVMSTPNRTWWSRVALVEAAERLGQIPRGTHDWGKFLTPDELSAMIVGEGFAVTDITGLSVGASGFSLGGSTALDYFVTAVRA